MDFLPDNVIVATQKSGSLWLFKNGARLGPIQGTPKVWFRGQGGLLSVKAHPDYSKNGWLYLTYADPAVAGSVTRIVRGQIKGLNWSNEQTIYQAPAGFYSDSGEHFGAALIFQGDYLYFSIGERGQKKLAQDLSDPRGKIHRLHADGSIPKDNPFIANKNAQPSIWSYGHRNPQGLAVHPQTQELWSAEHGPMGGDEINLIRKGRNYGWPLVTFGTEYDGTPISDSTHKDGLEPPRQHWSPSIGVSAIHFYTGTPFPKWRNQLLVASLAKQELHLVRIESGRVTKDEVLLRDAGRIRDVRVGPDGYPYVLLTTLNGAIYRLH
jgi:glucose/arabinose dehydrogenase